MPDSTHPHSAVAPAPRLDDPAGAEFFRRNHLPDPTPGMTLDAYWQTLSWQQQDLGGWTRDSIADGLAAFLATGVRPPAIRHSLDILPGRAKDGRAETHGLSLRPGEVVCIVGPTGSGKSRLLADIECLAQGDTPSGRRVRIDGRDPDPEWRFSGEAGIVAQISQNMNFVMDLSVAAFLELHAQSRGLADTTAAVERVLAAAISMAGEPFGADTPLTQLSGGQSRALMIADAALLSPKPVVLIDEIENAGVNRQQALEWLIGGEKIALVSTHDPLLALRGNRRVVIRNGAIAEVIAASPEEQAILARLEAMDTEAMAIRERLRRGQPLTPMPGQPGANTSPAGEHP